MADLTSRLIVKLIDGVSGTAKVVGASLKGLHNMNNRMALAMRSNTAAMARARDGLINTGIAAWAMAAPLKASIGKAAEFETLLTDIAQKGELTRPQMLGLGKDIMSMSKDFGISTMEIGKGVDALMGRGLGKNDAMASIGPMVKAAVAYGSTVEDISKASFASMDNLKVPAKEMTRALEIMAASGNEGAFELKNMATEFPTLTAQAAGLGMTGTKAVSRLSAALQIAMKGAGSSSEAANNVVNLLSKIQSPETTKKFKKFGIDIRKEVEKTKASGGDMFLMIAKQTNKALKGDLGKLGDVFSDMQVANALRPLIQNLQEYERIVNSNDNSGGLIDAEFARRQENAATQMARFNAGMERLGITVGTILLPALNDIIGAISPVVDAIARFAENNPEVVSSLVKIAAALTAITVASFAGRLAFGAIKQALLVGGMALMTVVSPITALSRAFNLLKLALVSSGVGAVLIGLAGAGIWISNNWNGIAAMFEGFAKVISEKFPALGKVFETVKSFIQPVYDLAEKLFGQVNMTTEEWGRMGEAIGNAFAGVVDWIANLPGKIAEAFKTLAAELYAAGAAAAQALWDGLASIMDGLPGKAAAKAREIGAAVRSGLGTMMFTTGGGQKNPTPTPNIFGAAGTPDGAGSDRRARGGDVGPGSYWVGEKGPELLRLGTRGTITPNHALAGKSPPPSIVQRITIHAKEGVEGVKQALSEANAELMREMRGAFT